MRGPFTAAELDLVDHWAQHTAEVSTRTGEADWLTFERSVRASYEQAGLPWPGVVIRVPSPLIGSLAAPIASQVASGRRGSEAAMRRRAGQWVRRTLHPSVQGETRLAVLRAVEQAVRLDPSVTFGSAFVLVRRRLARPSYLGSLLSKRPRAAERALEQAAGAQLVAELDAVAGTTSALQAAVLDAVERAVTATVRTGLVERVLPAGGFFAGQWAVGAHARLALLHELCGPGAPLFGRAMLGAQSSAGWWWPHRAFVMVSDRPRVLQLENGDPPRLHCDDGPALVWPDGWSLYFRHGAQVNGEEGPHQPRRGVPLQRRR